MRLPTGLKEDLETAAEAGSRTISNEIIRRLEWSFAAEKAGIDITPETTASNAVPDFERGRVHDLEKDIEALRAEVRALAMEVRQKPKLEK
jgi:hypothetical protein